MKKEKVRITVRFTEEENEKLVRCASLCGLSQSAFVRQLCKGETPKPVQPKEFWELMNTLYDLHRSLRKYPEASEICRQIEYAVIRLQEVV